MIEGNQFKRPISILRFYIKQSRKALEGRDDAKTAVAVALDGTLAYLLDPKGGDPITTPLEFERRYMIELKGAVGKYQDPQAVLKDAGEVLTAEQLKATRKALFPSGIGIAKYGG